ncbi:hypothetical protein JCM10207_003375 [Rhodosporidiobolus poonsookiae]
MLEPDGPSDLVATYDLAVLDEEGVHRLFTDLGIPHYHDQLHEHGITGDVLIHLDHSALKDVGIHSVGQRLAILKTVYDLKVLQNIPIEEGHYVPPSEEWDLDRQMASQQVLGLLSERDDRIRNLEHEVYNLHAALANLRDEALSIARSGGGKPRPNVRSPTSSGFPHPLSNASTLARSSSTPSRPRNLPPVAVAAASSLALPTGNGLPDSPASPIVDSPRIIGDYQQQQQAVHLHDASGSLHPGEFSINGVATPTTPTAPMLIHPDSAAAHAAASHGAPAHAPLLPSSANPLSASTSPSASHTPSSRPSTANHADGSAPPSSALSTSTSRTREGSSGNTADNPYRSFRVTLEDPCYKVLPAALKKYKINDDWRLYALFICYGNTERCLAYDEKPLLLFQRLKESNDNPVFMLRHIKDIKSPIAVASAKHAARRDKRPPGIGGGVERSLMGVTRDGSPATAATTANGLAPNARPTRLHHPPVLLPVGKDRKDGTAADDGAEGAEVKEPEKKGYCIAIYPYLAEREDEFDVAVGDTFVILSKTKGWWVVHRDTPPPSLSSSTSSNPDHSPAARRSAWVPAGCLLETSVPPLSLLADSPNLSSSTGSSSTKKDRETAGVPPHEGNASNVPIHPSFIVSVSTPGICLMDYTPRGQGELEVKKGQPLRILKRYNHWSYAVKSEDGKDAGGRGWVPSWFCGRANKGDGTPTTPTMAVHAASSQPSSTTASANSSALLTAPSSTISLSPLTAATSASSGSGSGSGSNSTLSPATPATGHSDSRPSTAPALALPASFDFTERDNLAGADSFAAVYALQLLGRKAVNETESGGRCAEECGSWLAAAKTCPTDNQTVALSCACETDKLALMDACGMCLDESVTSGAITTLCPSITTRLTPDSLVNLTASASGSIFPSSLATKTATLLAAASPSSTGTSGATALSVSATFVGLLGIPLAFLAL